MMVSIANDQLTLATANRHHGINRFQTGLQRLGHRLTRNNAGGDFFDRSRQLGVDLTLAVDWLTKCINHATTQLRANRHLENAARAFDGIALGDVLVTTENHRTDGITLEVKRQAERIAGELKHFALHCIGQAVNTANAIGDRDDRTLVTDLCTSAQALDSALDQLADFGRVDLHVNS
jgi:hypothetical protein